MGSGRDYGLETLALMVMLPLLVGPIASGPIQRNIPNIIAYFLRSSRRINLPESS
jgi:hypothetical protein